MLLSSVKQYMNSNHNSEKNETNKNNEIFEPVNKGSFSFKIFNKKTINQTKENEL